MRPRCFDKSAAAPLQEHDALTRTLMQRIGHDVEVLALGGDCSEKLRAEVKLLNSAPLDESAGEGFHRATNAEKIYIWIV